MAGDRISRNDPCPCGSGRKFKHCCISKGIDWEARRATARPPHLPAPIPRPALPPVDFIPGAFSIVDVKLKEIATKAPTGAAWKGQVESLMEATPIEQRVAAYRAIHEAGVLPADAAGFLFGHAAQWVFPDRIAEVEAEDEADEADDDALDRHTLAVLRRFGADDLADLYVTNRLEYDRRHERGRQLFHGPPDERHAERLREKGVID